MNLTRKAFRIVLLAAVIPFSPVARGDGSVSFATDILPMANERPLFAQFIVESFTVTDTGWGVRIDSPTMPKMKGTRIGPYEFQAEWRSPNGKRPVTLIIDTKIRYFDDHRREILGGDLRHTTSIVETLDSIEIAPPRQ
ncbi:hypothetical protein [Paraburkholderia humisilvae]|uniref:Uncharacterized protein n=1 Tax=Paraburkholderia humisilvae TaxID=627669 RepID=A0A6J5D399_9BURK|nr:hypothetical protein [Paraburkholderia humisilvae]CAB3748759.1 hypothetical protein LMG29542_00756 [Paraburkholderia humisilvae]